MSEAARLWRACQEPRANNDNLPAQPETVLAEVFSKAWRRADEMEQISYRLKMLWELLYPEIEGAFGMAVGPYNFVIEGTPEHDRFRILSNAQSELLFHHLAAVGSMIEEMRKVA